MADNASRPWRWFVPSLSHWLWLVLVMMLLQPAERTAMVASDGDTCMHWRVGEGMLQTHQIIRHDVYSHTRPGQPVISKEWLAEIIFAAAGRRGGLYALSVVAALVIATTFALLHGQLIREGRDILVATVLVLLASFAASTHWLARPHVFSFLMVVLWHDALRRFDRDNNARRLAVALGVLTLLWVNLHGAYLVGFLVLGAFWGGALLEHNRRKLTALTWVGLVCAAVSLLNPNGYELHLHNVQFLRSDYLTNLLGEYRSPNFHSPETRGFLVWLALIFFTLALRRPRVSAASAIVLLSWTYFALYAVRNIPLMVILTAPIIAAPLSEVVRGRWLELSQRMRRVSEAGSGWLVVAGLAAVAIIYFTGPTEMPADRWPAGAVDYVKAHRDVFRDKNLFNQYAWGGYLMEVLPEHKVFVDGRTDFYGESLIREFDDTAALRTNWTVALEKYHVDWTMMPSDHRLNLALELKPEWTRVYSNKVATIFVRAP